MARQRRAYSPEFKELRRRMLVVNTGRPPVQVAKEIWVAKQTLSRWVKTYRDQVGEVEPISESERAELQRLRKEKREWEQDPGVLKKSVNLHAPCVAADTQ